ncbi:hypothetical protein B0T25DRAFT_583186 [Lasiosphaeria hispida]|uniref:G domain-containing protein n=1 Tax=Lasiosphaeria hispida TaxID=260671 RepID=A0AAJ0HA90_9PEZI|nr:hypothetical protein B0T25DRAFT_583186 [Lasiosphaeria hispida]
MASDQQIEDIYIAVVGVAGAGRDSFISSFLGDNHLQHNEAAHSVDDASDPSDQEMAFLYSDTQRVHLVDIPGFTSDDDATEQQHILNRINSLVADGKTFSGVVFLHPIADEQTAGLALQNMELLRSLYGADSQTQKLTVLATSMWSRVTPELGATRERALVESDEFVGQLLNQEGGKVFRYEDTRESALDILSYLLSRQMPVAAEGVEGGVDKACQTGGELVGEWDKDIARAREKHMARLAEMYALMEQATREHDSNVRGIVKVEVESLQKRIREGEEERDQLKKTLDEVTQRKDGEVKALQEEISEERRRHVEETEKLEKAAREEREQLAKAAQEELARREEEEVKQREERVAAVRAEMTQESENRVKSLLEEMTHEADERVKAVRAEMTHVADERLNASRREMEKMKLEFEREREQNMKALRAEMSRLAEREKEAREMAQRAEVARKNEEYRQPLQAWAVARLWGVGQTRSNTW